MKDKRGEPCFASTPTQLPFHACFSFVNMEVPTEGKILRQLMNEITVSNSFYKGRLFFYIYHV